MFFIAFEEEFLVILTKTKGRVYFKKNEPVTIKTQEKFNYEKGENHDKGRNFRTA